MSPVAVYYIPVALRPAVPIELICGRCGGSGSFSWNPKDLDMCYGCRGLGYVLASTANARRETAGQQQAITKGDPSPMSTTTLPLEVEQGLTPQQQDEILRAYPDQANEPTPAEIAEGVAQALAAKTTEADLERFNAEYWLGTAEQAIGEYNRQHTRCWREGFTNANKRQLASLRQFSEMARHLAAVHGARAGTPPPWLNTETR